MRTGHKYGAHRVLEPKGGLPQAANKLDNDMAIYDNEILVDVVALHITATSFIRLVEEARGDEDAIARTVMAVVQERGKYQDTVTGSGGILIGSVAQVGQALQGKVDLESGERIATLVSLSLTPLKIDRVIRVDKEANQVYVEGQAVLFESGLYAKLPTDLPEALAMILMDVAGAPAHTARVVAPGDVVLIVGGGKAGLLCLHEAKKHASVTGQVILVERDGERCRAVEELGLADTVIQGDATKPLEIMEQVARATAGHLADVSINCVSVPDTEMATILSTRDGGTIYFFSMSTSFAKAALGAEGAGKEVTMLIGNGYTKGHAELTLQIIRENKPLRDFFQRVYLS
jgi:L-erythro-3,5-diaminohexanoate dehydrogenase